MTSTEGHESREPSGGLLAGGHPLPSLRPHKHRNCISRSAVMDEHPRPVSATSADLPDGRNHSPTAHRMLEKTYQRNALGLRFVSHTHQGPLRKRQEC